MDFNYTKKLISDHLDQLKKASSAPIDHIKADIELWAATHHARYVRGSKGFVEYRFVWNNDTCEFSFVPSGTPNRKCGLTIDFKKFIIVSDYQSSTDGVKSSNPLDDYDRAMKGM